MPEEREITRGHLMTAQSIAETYFRDAVTRQPIVSTKWIKAHCPNRVQLSYNRVCWYAHDVERWVKSLRSAA